MTRTTRRQQSESCDTSSWLMTKPASMESKSSSPAMTSWRRSLATETDLESLISEKVWTLAMKNSCSRILKKISSPGKPMNYDGDMDDEEEILDWLTNPENMEMTDSIERANRKMFEKIRKASDYLAVFFCKRRFPWGKASWSFQSFTWAFKSLQSFMLS